MIERELTNDECSLIEVESTEELDCRCCEELNELMAHDRAIELGGELAWLSFCTYAGISPNDYSLPYWSQNRLS